MNTRASLDFKKAVLYVCALGMCAFFFPVGCVRTDLNGENPNETIDEGSQETNGADAPETRVESDDVENQPEVKIAEEAKAPPPPPPPLPEPKDVDTGKSSDASDVPQGDPIEPKKDTLAKGDSEPGTTPDTDPPPEEKRDPQKTEIAVKPVEPSPPVKETQDDAESTATTEVLFASKDEWRMWGGAPGRNMVNPYAEGIPHTWDIETGKNIRWKAALGSTSYGNPVIARDRVLVGTNNGREHNPKIKGDKGVILCFNIADGKFVWQITHDKLASGRGNDWPEQGICSTPVVEDGKLYYVSNRCELVCADLDGFADGNDGPYKEEKYADPIDGDFIWILDMFNDLSVYPHNLATSSPLIIGDMVFILTSNGVAEDHKTVPSPRAPSFIGVNKKTGEVVWQSVGPGENILHGQWASPAYGVAGGVPQVVFPGGDGWLYSFEPKKGDLLWKFDCNPKDAKWDIGGLGTRNSIVATPVFLGDVVYMAVGQDPEHGEGPGNLYAIRADGTGDVTGSKQIWRRGGKDFGRTISTVAVHEGLVYAAELSGFLQCVDAKTGEQYWVHDLLATVWGSPAVIDGKVFMGDEDGDLLVCRAGKTFEKLAENYMDEPVYSTPVAAGGVLYIVNQSTLFAIATTK